MKTNTKRKAVPPKRNVNARTHEGAPADAAPAYMELRRSVLSCMLWENEFYESGSQIALRVKELCHRVTADQLANLAIKARIDYKLRHMPLYLARELVRHKDAGPNIVAGTIERVIQRADELAEFMAIYWKEGKCPIANAVKRGLGRVISNFDSYQLAKYNRDNAVALRDVLFMVHAKPKDIGDRKGKKAKAIARKGYKRGATMRHKTPQAISYQQLADDELPTPDTWETNLSGGANKKEVFERLLSENKLGYMALLRNLRNMEEAQVDRRLIVQRLREGAPKSKALPFRFIAAAVHAPRFEDVLDECMLLSLGAMDKLSGRTVLLIDNSGSMYQEKISAKSELTRAQAAQALAVMAREICEEVVIYAFSNKCELVPPRHGIALANAVRDATTHGGTATGDALRLLNEKEDYDRIIIFTDEQTNDVLGKPKNEAVGYIINVASNQYGIGGGNFVKIDGFSEQVLRFISVVEAGGE
jgi:hypothetical protein